MLKSQALSPSFMGEGLHNAKLSVFDKTPAASLAVENIEEQRSMGLSNFGKEQLKEALALLKRYKDGKAVLEERMKDEYLWWRRRHWEMFKKDGRRIPAGAQLFNSIENKIADIYDNIPECAFLARSQDDEETANVLTDVMPAILEQNDMEDAFCAVTREKVTVGTGVYAVTWDTSKNGGIGDVNIRSVSPLNLYWEPGVTDIQESPGLFCVYHMPSEVLRSEYPQFSGELGGDTSIVTEYLYDDTVDDTKRIPVIDYYYKRKTGMRTVLHYAKICDDEILYASENDEKYAESGWYDHGMYPFVFDVMFPLPGSPCGFGYVTVGKDQQHQIDRLNNAIVRNAIIASTRRKYIKKGADVNMDELMDIEKDVVAIGGNGSISENVMTIDEPTLSGNYIEILACLEGTLKETTANRDFAQGGTSGGVTSGTAISALVEAGNKQSRMIIRGSYDAYKRVVTLCLELLRQFGINERAVRITGSDGSTRYTTFSNASIIAQPQTVGGVDIGSKEPVFDIKIRAHKKSPFARVTQNSTMQEFYGMGFFAPENATQALACLDGMEFDGKDTLCRKIEENGTIYTENIQLKQAMLRLAAIIDMEKGTNLTAEMAQSFGVDTSSVNMPGATSGAVEESPDIMQSASDPRMKKSAEGVANSTGV